MADNFVRVRRFNAEGQDDYLNLIRQKPLDVLDQVDRLVMNPEKTEALEEQVDMEIRPMVRRLDLGEHLVQYFGPTAPLHRYSRDAAVWNWVAGCWMRALLDAAGETNTARGLGKQEARWVLTSDVTRYHRHLVSSAYFAYESNSSQVHNAMCLLANPILKPGEVVERIAGKRSLSMGPLCHLATLLYFDPKTKQLRKGHTSGPGTPKKFSYYFNQVEQNVDYEGMDVEDLLNMLPKNFERWVELAKSER